MPPPDPRLATRRSLLSRLRDWNDDRSWQEFFDTYWKLIYWAAAQAGLNDGAAQDVVQEVVLAVARRMPDFRYDPAVGSFKNWLLQITRRKINDHFRRQYRDARIVQPRAATESATAGLENIPDPAGAELERRWDAEWERNLMDAALRRVKARVDPRQYQIFDCHVVKGWPVKDVVAALGVTENQVYLAKSRVSALVRAECERLREF